MNIQEGYPYNNLVSKNSGYLCGGVQKVRLINLPAAWENASQRQ